MNVGTTFAKFHYLALKKIQKYSLSLALQSSPSSSSRGIFTTKRIIPITRTHSQAVTAYTRIAYLIGPATVATKKYR